MSSPDALSSFLLLSAAPLSVVPVDGPLAVLLSFFSPQPASEKSSSAVTKSMARVCFIAAFLLTFISRDTQALVCARSSKKPDVNFVKTHGTDTNSAKSLAEFRAHRREIILIVISNDMCVRKILLAHKCGNCLPAASNFCAQQV
jgi:hypothetical protein